jgi:hypothetical protein
MTKPAIPTLNTGQFELDLFASTVKQSLVAITAQAAAAAAAVAEAEAARSAARTRPPEKRS